MYINCFRRQYRIFIKFLDIALDATLFYAFGEAEKSGSARLCEKFASVSRANFQDRLVMTASITLRVDYLIVLFLRFFLAFRILDRDHFGQVFYRLENGVF